MRESLNEKEVPLSELGVGDCLCVDLILAFRCRAAAVSSFNHSAIAA